MRIALAQLNLTVGDIRGNFQRIVDAVERAESTGAQLLALPELTITGYPPEDLLLKSSFLDANRKALDEIAGRSSEALVIVGFVEAEGERLYNAAAVCQEGEIKGVYRKHLLPNYGVFDERRYFEAGDGHVLIETPEGVIGLSICEDAWSPTGPVVVQGDAGAQIIVNINASPFHKGKVIERTDLMAARARRARAALVYVNLVGGQDELVFDGGSLVVSPNGELVARLPQFEEHFAVVDVPPGETNGERSSSMSWISANLPSAGARPDSQPPAEPLPEEAEIYRALELALRDYVGKNRFEKVVVGLSGGIDSSLTATIAADALGPEAVLAVVMPSEFSSSDSTDDAKQLAANLGIELMQIPITRTYHAYLEALEAAFGDAEPGIAEENIQARIRGNLLMAVSNRYNHLVVATGNKSEMACGYATLYGDMAGGFTLLKDVFKTEVYALARYRNSRAPAIPENVLRKAPSAELRHGQKDSDSLPEYSLLDPLLEAYIHHDASIEDMVGEGQDRETVEKVVTLVDKAEYKRRQAPPGPKVTTKAFGRDRRLPITNRWREGGPFQLPERSVGTTEQSPEGSRL